MKIFDLPALFKTLLILLLSLLPTYLLLAQDVTAEKHLRIKMIKNINGEMRVLDTLITAKDHDEAIRALEGLKPDPVRLKKINAAIGKTYKIDTVLAGSRLKGIIYNGKNMIVDTVRFKSISGDSVRVYRLNRTLDASTIDSMLERVKVFKADTATLRNIKERQAFFYRIDTTDQHIFKRHIVSEAGDTIRFESMVPSVSFTTLPDSVRVLMVNEDLKYLKNIRVKGIEKILVQGDGIDILKLDSTSTATVHRFEVIKGEQHVYVIDEKGNKKEIEGDKYELNTGLRNVIIQLKADVQKLSKVDKELLLEAGNEIETSMKEALKIDDITFYPNPNNGRFNLSFNLEGKGDAAIRIMNSNGKEIYREVVEASIGEYNKQIDISGMGKGIFYLQVVQGERYATRKVLVQ